MANISTRSKTAGPRVAIKIELKGSDTVRPTVLQLLQQLEMQHKCHHHLLKEVRYLYMILLRIYVDCWIGACPIKKVIQLHCQPRYQSARRMGRCIRPSRTN
jgi:hypothetical protein